MAALRQRSKLLIILFILALLIGGFFLPVQLPHVQLPAEQVFTIGGFPITNTVVAGWLTTLVLMGLSFTAMRDAQLVPGRLQNLVEAVLEQLLSIAQTVAGPEKGRRFFPLVSTFFLFIVISNWMGLLPGYGTIGIWEEGTEHGKAVLLPLLRSANTDLNTTLALALISVVATQYFGVRMVGVLGYAGRFVNFSGANILQRVISAFVGMLELVSEVAKIVSFSFRLFGNIFAGEVLLGVMVFLIPWVASIPFYGLELFVGLIQAFIFAMLTLVFCTIATMGHGKAH